MAAPLDPQQGTSDSGRWLRQLVAVGLLIGGVVLMVDAWNAQDITGRITPDEMVVGVLLLIGGLVLGWRTLRRPTEE